MKRFALGLGALVLVLALLVGIPAALLFLAGNPFPTGAELSRALSTPDYGGAFLVGTLLPLIAWVAWATFALGFLVELPGHVRGIPSPHLPGLGLQQLWAAALIGAIVVMLTGVGAMAGSTTGDLPTDQASASVSQSSTVTGYGAMQSDADTAVTVAETQAAEAAPAAPAVAAPTYTVQPGDSLWRIAEQHLGSGERFAEIAALNLGVTQGDGHTLTAENWLNAGWVLTLPADAATPAAPAAALPAEHVVVEGDTLWDLADDAYGDGARYAEIFSASSAVVQPDGSTITDPNLIQPGETVTLPGAGAPVEAAPTVPASDPSSDAAAVGATTAAEAATQHAVDLGMVGGDTPAIEATSAAGAEAFSHDAPASTIGGIGAVLAVGLLGLLGLRRVGQRSRREDGRRIALPTAEASTLELELRAVENRVGLDDIDHALRYLAVWAEDTGRSLPSIEAIRLSDDDITLYLSGTDPLPRPFQPGTVPGRVAVDAEPSDAATGEAVPADAETGPSPVAGTAAWKIDRSALPGVERVPHPPYPAFVTVGQDGTGAQILVDLERLGTLAVTGPPELRLGVLTAIAAELATSRRSEIRVTIVGAADDVTEALTTPRLRHVPDVATLLAQPAETGPASHSPEIVILTASHPALSDRQRATLSARSARLGIVQGWSSARPTAAGGTRQWTLSVDDVGAASLEPLGISVAPQLLGAGDCARLISLFRSTDAQSVAGPEWARRIGAGGVGESGPAALVEPLTPGAAGAPWIRLLGPVEVFGARTSADGQAAGDAACGSGPIRLPWSTELVAYFTVHRTASAVDVQTALWPADLPTGLTAQQNRNKLMSETRAWLGDNPDGEPYLPVVGADGLRLHPDVQSDWDVWLRLVGDDVSLTSTATLMGALSLVAGAPLSDLPANQFAWAEPLREEIIGSVLDAATELAARARISKDADAAARVAEVEELLGARARTADQVSTPQRG
jgi:nucleoid-associated protein YgaU